MGRRKRGHKSGYESGRKRKYRKRAKLTVEQWKGHAGTPKTIDELNEYYKNFFEGASIPYISFTSILQICGAIPRLKCPGHNVKELIHQRKSILIPYIILETPVTYETRRGRGFNGSGRRRNIPRDLYLVSPPRSRLELPPPTVYHDSMPFQIQFFRRTVSVAAPWASLSSKMQNKDKKVRPRYKFRSDKQHELSEDECLSSMAPTTAAPLSSMASSFPRKKIIGTDFKLIVEEKGNAEVAGQADSDQTDSGQGSASEISPENSHSNDGYDTDIDSELSGSYGTVGKFRKTRFSAIWDSPQEDSYELESSDGEFSRFSSSPDADEEKVFATADKFNDGDLDILIIGLTEDEMNEF